ncbi:late embryogenesis abundant protein At1g64065 [Arachis hypogaea]|uniref:late embryogenesis abundant protein At1g64065 n=1 Tax=Arachis hypogaea TaxID=3818 RepID=UPI003B11F072
MAQVLPSKFQSEEIITKFALHKEKKQSSKCLVYTLACFVTLFGVCLCFASVVLRVREPKIEIKSAKMMHVGYSITSSSSPSYASFNVTMIFSMMIINPNYGHFSYHNSSVKFLYGVVSVGERGIVGSRVKGRDIQEFNVMVNARSSNNINYSGVTKLRSYAELSGCVQVLKIVNKRKNIVMACIMTLNFTSHSIQHLQLMDCMGWACNTYRGFPGLIPLLGLKVKLQQ